MQIVNKGKNNDKKINAAFCFLYFVSRNVFIYSGRGGGGAYLQGVGRRIGCYLLTFINVSSGLGLLVERLIYGYGIAANIFMITQTIFC